MTLAEVGNLAPDFTTKNHHGQPITLSALRGGPVALVFYPFAFTGVCTGELNALQAHLGAFESAGATLLALSTDTMFTLRVFADQERLGFDLLSDHWPHGEIASTYGVFDADVGCALRGSFLVDAGGVIRWKVVNAIGEPRDIAEHVTMLGGRKGTRTPDPLGVNQVL